jgi:hypothetical protein
MKPPPCISALSEPACAGSGRWSSTTTMVSANEPPRPAPSSSTQVRGARSGHNTSAAKPAACSASESHNQGRRSRRRAAKNGSSKAMAACATDNSATSEPLAAALQPSDW